MHFIYSKVRKNITLFSLCLLAQCVVIAMYLAGPFLQSLPDSLAIKSALNNGADPFSTFANYDAALYTLGLCVFLVTSALVITSIQSLAKNSPYIVTTKIISALFCALFAVIAFIVLVSHDQSITIILGAAFATILSLSIASALTSMDMENKTIN